MPLHAVVLVGGLGTRLRPLTLTTPKPLVPLVDRPALGHILRWLEAAGVDDVILATQYGAAAFAPFLRRWRGLPVQAIAEDAPLGTAGAVRNVRAALTGTTVIVNGDNLTTLDLAALIAEHRRTGAAATISTAAVADPTGRGVVVSDAQGRVTVFQEKPAPGTALALTINAGTYVIEPAVLDRLPAGQPAMWETDLFPALIGAGIPIFASTLPQRWVDVGTPSGYLAAQQLILARALGQLSYRAAQPGLWVDDNVSWSAAARLAGPAALGFGAVVASGVLLGNAALGREVQVLPGCQITGSAIWDGTLVEQGATIIDSIVGYNCYIGAGAHLSGALLGDGCVVAAGAQLGPGSTAAPGSHVDGPHANTHQ